jgi:hypothetical protein
MTRRYPDGGDIFATAYPGVGADRDGPGKDGQSWFRGRNKPLSTPLRFGDRRNPVRRDSTRCKACPAGYSFAGIFAMFVSHDTVARRSGPDSSRQKANRRDLGGVRWPEAPLILTGSGPVPQPADCPKFSGHARASPQIWLTYELSDFLKCDASAVRRVVADQRRTRWQRRS